MKFIPYFEEVFQFSLDEPNLEKRIQESKLEGRYVEGLLKLQRKTWIGNSFRPVACCYYLTTGANAQTVRVIFRPDGFGLAFMAFWIGSLILGIVDALFDGVFIAFPFFIGLILAGYTILMIGFWIEIPMLKRELHKLFMPDELDKK